MLCVIAKLNEEATEKLMAIRKAALSDAVVKPLYGHITIATYTGDNEAQFIRFCKSLLEGMPSFTVRYEKLAVLEATSIIVASPEKSGPLEALHLGIAKEYNCALHPAVWAGPGFAPDMQGNVRFLCAIFLSDFFSRVFPGAGIRVCHY